LLVNFLNFSKRTGLETFWSHWVSVHEGSNVHMLCTCQSNQLCVIWVHFISSSFWHKIVDIFRVSILTINASQFVLFQLIASRLVIYYTWFVLGTSFDCCLITHLGPRGDFIDLKHQQRIGQKHIILRSCASLLLNPHSRCHCATLTTSNRHKVSRMSLSHPPQKVHFSPLQISSNTHNTTHHMPHNMSTVIFPTICITSDLSCIWF
jgi:hypothetical protein